METTCLYIGALLLLSQASGNPVPNNLPWASPCGVPSTTSGGVFPLVEPLAPTLKELATELHTRSFEANSLAISLRDKFFQNRLGSSLNLALALESGHVPNYPLPADILMWTNFNDTANVTKKDYTNLSTVLVYLEAVRFDDIEYHSSTSLAAINSLESKLLGILCTIQSILGKLNTTIDSHLSRDVMPEGVRVIENEAVRHQRDFIIAKDAVHVMTKTKQSHLQMALGIQ